MRGGDVFGRCRLDDGGTLLGTFTTDDSLQSLLATSLTVAGGSLGVDSVIFNAPSYITDGVVNLPNGFRLVAYSSVNKSLSVSFTAPLTQAGAGAIFRRRRAVRA